MFLATAVSHTLSTLRRVLAQSGALADEPAVGVIRLSTGNPANLLSLVSSQLTSPESEEVRVVVVDDPSDSELLGAALRAPSLAQVAARTRHVDLQRLIGDEDRSFRSVYQPIVRLDSGGREVVGYEALLRADDAGGQVMPAALFGAAREAGWLHILDRIGRTTALRGAAGWLGDALLFVNFLPTAIYRPEVCLMTTERAAADAGIAMDQLVFEVTESERVTDPDHLARVFEHYRRLGCRVALDDLGAGYSSLNLLARLQPDVVKLDKEIVQGLPGAGSEAVVSSVVSMTHRYGGVVIAECVETAEQASSAAELGVDLGQGWLFGAPEDRRP